LHSPKKNLRFSGGNARKLSVTDCFISACVAAKIGFAAAFFKFASLKTNFSNWARIDFKLNREASLLAAGPGSTLFPGAPFAAAGCEFPPMY
jgi:hypothetical protein